MTGRLYIFPTLVSVMQISFGDQIAFRLGMESPGNEPVDSGRKSRTCRKANSYQLVKRMLGSTRAGLTLAALLTTFFPSAADSKKTDDLVEVSESHEFMAADYEILAREKLTSILAIYNDSEGGDNKNFQIIAHFTDAGEFNESASREHIKAAANLKKALQAENLDSENTKGRIRSGYDKAHKNYERAIINYKSALEICELQPNVTEFLHGNPDDSRFSSDDEGKAWLFRVGSYLERMAGLERKLSKTYNLEADIIEKTSIKLTTEKNLHDDVESLRNKGIDSLRKAKQFYQDAAQCYRATDRTARAIACESKVVSLLKHIFEYRAKKP
jgi:hypothetical protein